MYYTNNTPTPLAVSTKNGPHKIVKPGQTFEDTTGYYTNFSQLTETVDPPIAKNKPKPDSDGYVINKGVRVEKLEAMTKKELISIATKLGIQLLLEAPKDEMIYKIVHHKRDKVNESKTS